MRDLPLDSVDAVVTDPPYGIGFMGKEWDKPGSFVERKPARRTRFDHVGGNHNPTCSADAARTRHVEGRRFGAWCEEWAAEALRVLKPGGHMLAFGGTRTFHRLVTAIEEAGFEVRDTLLWVYGSGFPKSHNLTGEHAGWGTALKPAFEPIILARKPLSERTVAANVLRWGTGALNIDGCRVATDTPRPGRTNAESRSGLTGTGSALTYGYAIRGSVAVEDTTLGRWPANLTHDGSDEVVALFPTTTSNSTGKGKDRGIGYMSNAAGSFLPPRPTDTGSAARFFYAAKASKTDRAGSKHPTVKPQSLMRYLCRLVTPPGGTVLDPFAGSGSTLQSARDEGFSAIGIEQDTTYIGDIERRLCRDSYVLL